MTYRYRPAILTLLASHGVIPTPATPPEIARSVVNGMYRYELRLLRQRFMTGEFSKADYYAKVVETRNRYPVMAVLTRYWIDD